MQNLPGWCTLKKIVVIESDDWGSLNFYKKEDANGAYLKLYEEMLNVQNAE